MKWFGDGTMQAIWCDVFQRGFRHWGGVVLLGMVLQLARFLEGKEALLFAFQRLPKSPTHLPLFSSD